ncbi:hypothetical protein [Streptosporangium pseudovulgare]|uniref:Uncharacterized protein n=1 Tax=Streptosporangium pseudovulgare TaxID=35765 RepID=A0ABQ2QMW8_9ACTN|nr:hypothetical protein [Streptosporangium pseudovulgare]GGP88354.1 hypothetical protein GCM10010140_17460 [Streptosporangium pseudovulgare]
MGKFDGMDPELVRDLLSEVRQAAEQMRAVEGRVTRLMSAAGLSSQSAHRPAQVADSGEKMVRDVSARVALLEKKIKQGTGHEVGPKAAAPKPDTEPSKADDRAPERPKAEDLTPAVPKDDGGSDARHDAGSDAKKDSGAKHGTGSDAKHDPDAEKDAGPGDKQEVRRDAKVEDKPQTGSKGDETAPRRDGTGSDAEHDTGSRSKQDAGSDAKHGSGDKQDAGPGDKQEVRRDAKVEDKPQTGSKGDETAPRRDASAPDTSARRDDPVPDTSARRDDSVPDTSARRDDSTPESPGGRSDGKIEIISIGDHDAGQDPGGDAGAKQDTGSKGDERSPRADQTGTQQVGTGQQGADRTGTDQQTADRTGTGQTGTGQQTADQTGTGQGTSGADILDTPRKDHPDDIDQSDPRPKVVSVDGVKVLQIPLDPPTAAEVTELLNNAGDVPPADVPTVDGVPDPAGAPPAQDASQGVPTAQGTAPGAPTTQDVSQSVPTAQHTSPGASVPHTVSQGVPTAQDAAHTASQGVPTVQGAVDVPVAQGTADAPATGTPATSGGSGAAEIPLDRPGQVEPHGPVRDVKPAFPIPDTVEPVPDQEIQPPGTGGEPETRSSGTAGDAVPRQAPPVAGAAGGGDVVSVRVVPPDPDVLAALVDDARDVEPMDMPSVRVPDGEVWGEGAWRPMDVGPDGPAGDLDPGDPLRPIPPPGDERQGGR